MSALAQDLALLLLDDESGRTTIEVGRRHRAVGCAVLLDLARAGRITVETSPDKPREAHVVAGDGEPTGDRVLDEALASLSGRGRTALGWAAETTGHRAWRPLMETLVERGRLRHEKGRVLGLIPSESWPSADPAYEAEVVERVRGVVMEDRRTDETAVLLVTVLHDERAGRIVRESTDSGPWKEALKGFDGALLTVLLAV
jgi:hypothetical protein